MKLITSSGFKLPFLGKDKFIELMRLGIGYNRETRSFQIVDLERIQQAKEALEKILGEEVAFGQTCVFCNVTFNCRQCKFYIDCNTHDVPLYCICPNCYGKPALYHDYMKKIKAT